MTKRYNLQWRGTDSSQMREDPNGFYVSHAAYEKLLDALKYPRFGNTADLLEQAASKIDAGIAESNAQSGENWVSFFTPHLKRAADRIRQALKETENA